MQKIGFCDRYGLTQAVLNGTKTMTRRLEKGLENLEEGNFCYSKHNNAILLYGEKGSVIETIRTRYKLGEVVAVAQQYSELAWDARMYEKMKSLCDGGLPQYHLKGWTNKMFIRADLMPHQIMITGVRIERLQAISDDDCLKEGIEYSKYERNWFYTNDKNTEFHAPSPRKAFAALINRPGVGRKGLWESNPWVVVYSFKLVK